MTQLKLTGLNKSRFFEYLNVFLVTLVVFGPILYLEIFLTKGTSDYGSHLSWARGIFENIQSVPKEAISHAGWQWAVILVHLIIGHSWSYSAIVITFGSVALSSGVLYWLLRKQLNPLLAGSLSIGLLLVAPLFFINPFKDLWFMVNGYIGTNVYHNPTILLLKPLVILQVYYSIRALSGEKSNWKGYILPTLCSILAVYTKPNFALCLLPVVCLLALIRIIRKQPVDWKKILFSIVIPSALVLGWQYFITYGENSNSGVVFAPLFVMKYYSSDLLAKLLLSMVFPIIVTLVFWKEAIQDTKMQLGWLVCIIGLALTYFFAESGTRAISGNFVWSGEISLFILFVCCVLFLAEKKFHTKGALSKWLVLSSGFLHLFFGFIYYFYICFSVLREMLYH